MTKIDECIWQATVSSSASNITFNRLSPNGQTQWNSFSAGGRGTNNAYYVDVLSMDIGRLLKKRKKIIFKQAT